MLDWETAATLSTVVAIGRAVADRAGRDPVAYYGFAQLTQASPDLSRWPLMLPEYPRGNAPGRYLSLVERPPRLPPGRASAWDGADRPTISTNTPRPVGSPASRPRSTARSGSAPPPI